MRALYTLVFLILCVISQGQAAWQWPSRTRGATDAATEAALRKRVLVELVSARAPVGRVRRNRWLLNRAPEELNRTLCRSLTCSLTSQEGDVNENQATETFTTAKRVISAFGNGNPVFRCVDFRFALSAFSFFSPNL